MRRNSILDEDEYSIQQLAKFWQPTKMISSDFICFRELDGKNNPFSGFPDHYGIGVMSFGLMEIEIDGNLIHATKGVFMINRPKEKVKVLNRSNGAKGYFVLFSKGFLDILQENIFSVKKTSFLSYGVQNSFFLSSKVFCKVSKYFRCVFDLLSLSPTENWEQIARNLTSVLMYELEEVLKIKIDTHKIESNRNEIIYRDFIKLTNINYNKNRTVSFYSSKLSITANHLYNVVKSASGHTPSYIIQNLVLNNAKSLLNSSNMNISEVAYKLNFKDPFTFSRWFKNQTGFSPSKYRLN